QTRRNNPFLTIFGGVFAAVGGVSRSSLFAGEEAGGQSDPASAHALSQSVPVSPAPKAARHSSPILLASADDAAKENQGDQPQDQTAHVGSSEPLVRRTAPAPMPASAQGIQPASSADQPATSQDTAMAGGSPAPQLDLQGFSTGFQAVSQPAPAPQQPTANGGPE